MKHLLASSLLFWVVTLHAQKVEIDWIELNGNKVIVHYSLDDTNPNNQYMLNLYTSLDNYTAALSRVSGDVGTEVKPGKNKSITWDITREQSNFKGNLQFELRGRVYVPFVKLTQAETGKVYKRGKNYPLNWTSGNLSGQVNIELFKGQDRIPVENNVPNIGKYEWHLPASLKKGSDYRLKFTNSRDRNEFIFSNEFTVKPKIPALVKLLLVGALAYGGYEVAKSGGDPPSQEEPLPSNPGKPN